MRFYSRYNTHDHCGDDNAQCDPIIDDEQLPKFWDFLGKRYYFDDVDKTSTTTARYHLIKGGGDHVEHDKVWIGHCNTILFFVDFLNY